MNNIMEACAIASMIKTPWHDSKIREVSDKDGFVAGDIFYTNDFLPSSNSTTLSINRKGYF